MGRRWDRGRNALRGALAGAFARMWVPRVVLTWSILLAVAILLASWLTRQSPWWSGVLANLGVTVLLLGPAAYVAHLLTGRVREAQDSAAAADSNAKEARAEAAEAAQAVREVQERLAALDIEEALFEHQLEPLRDEVKAYGEWAEYLDRKSLIRALNVGIDSGLISTTGIRCPVWETDAHIRFSLRGDEVLVTVEDDAGNVRSEHPWPEDLDALELYKQLDAAMSNLGWHLGPKLFSPRQFVVDTAEALTYAAEMRAQKLRWQANHFDRVIEPFEGWFLTEGGLVAKERIYHIGRDRMDDLDWEEHLGNRYPDVLGPLAVARAYYARVDAN